MSTKSALFVVLCLGLAVSVVFAMADKCNMDKVEKASVCEKCNSIDPKVDADGKCCGAKPVQADVCVKTSSVCSVCKKAVTGDKACCPDGKVETVVDKALIVNQCEACGASGKAGEKCGAECCKGADKKIVPMCSKSGKAPHGGEAAK